MAWVRCESTEKKVKQRWGMGKGERMHTRERTHTHTNIYSHTPSTYAKNGFEFLQTALSLKNLQEENSLKNVAFKKKQHLFEREKNV